MKSIFFLFFVFFSSSLFAILPIVCGSGTVLKKTQYHLGAGGTTPNPNTTYSSGSWYGANPPPWSSWSCQTGYISHTTESSYLTYSGLYSQYIDIHRTQIGTTYLAYDSCGDGYAPDSNNICTLIPVPDCPVGKIKDASGKYCVAAVCPIGSTRDPITLHCLPIKCPTGQTLISDGTCQTTCPPNSSRVDKICRYDCGHWSYATCGKYLNSKGETCLFSPLSNNSWTGECMSTPDFALHWAQAPLAFLGSNIKLPTLGPGAWRGGFIGGAPKLPEPLEPIRIKPWDPTVEPVVKPANVPDYVPPVEPVPVEPIPLKPLEPVTPLKPANDPDYVPTIEPVTPLTPDIAPYTPPAPAPAPLPEPAPLPLPAPEPLPAPVPSPSPVPLPAPSPIVAPVPAPAPSPSPLPMPKPDYTFDPVPPPATDPVTGEPVPAPTPSPYPAIEPMPNVSMPAVPDVLDFSIDDMDKFRYNATTMSRNILDQVDNVQNTFFNTKNLIEQGFPPVTLPSGSCGSTMAFDFYGKHIDLCPPLAEATFKFARLFQLFVFMIGLIASIKIFISGLRD